MSSREATTYAGAVETLKALDPTARVCRKSESWTTALWLLGNNCAYADGKVLDQMARLTAKVMASIPVPAQSKQTPETQTLAANVDRALD